MIDHISFSVKDYQKSREFYDQTLEILGYARLFTFDLPTGSYAAYGRDPKPSLWIGSAGKKDEEVGQAQGLHIAFLAPSLQAVHDWYDKCLELGGEDNGAPGPRPEYHPGYYGAFIVDPNGWRIEACLHDYDGA